jgi:nucleotide-binding universal stress UspA family protein
MRQPAVVAGVDGSASALHAVRWAAREAARRHVPLRLVHVSYLVPEQPEQLPDDVDVLLDQPRQWLAQAADAAWEVTGPLEITTELVDGTVAKALIEESASARLIVLGQRRLAEFSDLLLGSVPAAVAAHAHCPVVIVRSSTLDSPASADGPVVVGVDESALSDAAIGFAIDAASLCAVPLVTALPTIKDLERLAGWREKYPEVAVRPVVMKGRPVHALLEVAHEAQLLVVSSVSHTMLRHAPCPIAVVR